MRKSMAIPSPIQQRSMVNMEIIIVYLSLAYIFVILLLSFETDPLQWNVSPIQFIMLKEKNDLN